MRTGGRARSMAGPSRANPAEVGLAQVGPAEVAAGEVELVAVLRPRRGLSPAPRPQHPPLLPRGCGAPRVLWRGSAGDALQPAPGLVSCGAGRSGAAQALAPGPDLSRQPDRAQVGVGQDQGRRDTGHRTGAHQLQELVV